MNNNWDLGGHVQTRKVVSSQVSKELLIMGRQARKIGDIEFARQIDEAITSTHEIASTLSKALSVRSVADYNPEVIVKFQNNRDFSLTNVPVASAQDWLLNIQTHMQIILSVWNQRIE